MHLAGFFSMYFIALVVFYIAFRSETPNITHPMSSTTIFTSKNFFQNIGLILCNYSGHAVFPNISSSMKNPQDFKQVLIWTYSCSLIFYLSVGVAGLLTL